jgi:hypothetical protein
LSSSLTIGPNITITTGSILQNNSTTSNVFLGNVGIGGTNFNSNLTVIGNSYFSGQIGIGTTTYSTYKLYVGGNSYINGNIGVSGSIIGALTGNSSTATDLASGSLLIVAKGGTGQTTFIANTLLIGNGTSALSSATGLTWSSSILNIASGGYITIGTGTAQGKIHIFETGTGTDASATGGTICLDHTTSNGVSSIVFKSPIPANSDYGYIKYIDNVSAGTTYAALNIFNLPATPTDAGMLVIGCEGDTNDSVLINPSGNIALVPKNNITYIKGNVGIGSTNPTVALDVVGTINATSFSGPLTGNVTGNCSGSSSSCTGNAANVNGKVAVSNGGTGLNAITANQLLLGGTTANTIAQYAALSWDNSTNQAFNVTGQIIATNDITAFSDRRLKENIIKLNDVEKVFNSISGYSFNWNEKGQELLNKSFDEVEICLIAQEVLTVIPCAISLSSFNNNDEKYLTIKYTKLIPYLVEGYKLLNDKYNKQQEQINEIYQILGKK